MIQCFCTRCGPKGRWFRKTKSINIHLGVNKTLDKAIKELKVEDKLTSRR